MDKAGLIAQIVKAEGLKGADAEARRRSLDSKNVKELEQMLNSALSNSKTYKADGSEKSFSFLGENDWAALTELNFNGNVWGNGIVSDDPLLPELSESTKKEYSLVQQKKLDEFLAQFLYDSATAGVEEITGYNKSVGWLNITDRAVNGFKVLTGQEDRFGIQERLSKEQKDAQELKDIAAKQPGAFEARIERKYGIPYNHENVEKLKKASEEFTRVSAYHDKLETLKQGFSEVKNTLRQEQEYEQARKHVRGPAAASLTPPEQSSHEKFGEVLLEFCDGDTELLNQYMQSLSKKYTNSSDIKKNMPKIMDELQKQMQAEYKKELKGKSFEKYEAEFNAATEKVLGKKDSKTIAKNFVQNAKAQAAYTEIGIVIATSLLLPGSSAVKGAVKKAAVKYGEKAAMQGMKAGMTFGVGTMSGTLGALNAATSEVGFTPEAVAEIKEKFKSGLMYGGFGAYASGPLGMAVEKVLSKNPSALTSLVSKAFKPAGVSGAQAAGGLTETSADVLFDLITSDMSFKESFEMNGIMNLGMMIAGGQIARRTQNAMNDIKILQSPDGSYVLKDKTGKELLKTNDPNTVAGFVLGKGYEAAQKSAPEKTQSAVQKPANNVQQGVNISDYKVEKADETTLKDIYEIDKEAFAETDPVADRFEDYKADIDKQNLESYVIKNKDGKVAGYFQLEPMHGDQLYIYSIGVPKELRNTKSSFAALKQIQENIKNIALKNGARTVALHVDASNKPLVKLYEKFGFKTVDTEQNYFANGDDALYMEADVAENTGTKSTANAPASETVSFKAAENEPSAKESTVKETQIDLSDLKEGMESKAGEKLFEKLGIKNIELGANAKYFDSIVNDLGEDFVDFITQRKDISTTENVLVSFMEKFANTANADMAKFIHDYKKGGEEFNEYELQALFENPKVVKKLSEFYRIAHETGLGDVINADAAWKSIQVFSGYFKPGDGSVIRKNLTALKQSGIKFDASDGMHLTLSTMGALKDKSPEDILALLNKINDATGGKTQNDSSLSAFIGSATKQPETFDEALKYGKLFGGELKDFKAFAYAGDGLKNMVDNGKTGLIEKMHDAGYSTEDALSVIKKFGTNGNAAIKTSSPEMLEALIILAKKNGSEKLQERAGSVGDIIMSYRQMFDDKTSKNLLDVVKVLDKELPEFKITDSSELQALDNFAHFRTPDEIKNVAAELKQYIEKPSLTDLKNYISFKKLKPEIDAAVSRMPKRQQEVMKYLCAPENLLKHSESIDIDSIDILCKIAAGDPQIIKEIYVLNGDTLKSRGQQFSLDEISKIVNMKSKQYEVFKGLMVLDEKYLPDSSQNPSMKKRQLTFEELQDVAKYATVKSAPDSDAIIDRVKELLILHEKPGMDMGQLTINEITNFVSLDEKQYQRVIDMYPKAKCAATVIKKAAALPDDSYEKFVTDYLNKQAEYPTIDFHDAVAYFEKGKEAFDAALELFQKGYPSSNLSAAITRVSPINFNKAEFVEKISKLNPDISPSVLGKNFNVKNLEPERINDFVKTLMDNKKQLQHNDRPLLQDKDILGLINGPFGYSSNRNLVKLFSILDDETIKASMAGKYDGVKHLLDLSNHLDFYGVEEIPVLKEKLAQLPLPQQRLDKFIAIMEVTSAKHSDSMDLVDLIKSPKVTDTQKQTMQRIFSSGKPYAEQIDDFIKEMNVPKSSEKRVREFLQKGKFNERISIKTVDTKAQLAKIEKNIAATIANDKMPQDKKDARLAQLNSQKEALKNTQDSKTVSMSPQALADLTRMVEHHINQVNNDIEFNRAITDQIYSKHGIKPSVELQDKLEYDIKYETKLLSGDSDFSTEYKNLIKMMDSDPSKPLSELRESVPENQATRKLFEENGLDYEKWTKFDETFEKPFTLEVNAREALESVQKNAAGEFAAVTLSDLPDKDIKFIESIIADVYKNKFKTEMPAAYTSDKGFVKKDGQPLTRQQHITLIQEVIDKIKENKEFGIEKNSDGTTRTSLFANEFLNHLESRIKDLNDAAQLKDMKEELYVRLSDDDDVGRNLFFGNHVHCCTSVQNFNGFAQPQHLMNTYVRGIEIVDKNGNSYGNSMCYFAKVDGKLTFVIDSFEANGKLGASKEVTDAIISTGKLICAEMGRPDAAVMLGPNYNKIDTSRFALTSGHTIEIIGRAPERTYIDCIGGRGNINVPAEGKIMNEVKDIAHISNVRPKMKGVESLSQRDAWNINQNSQDIARTIHEKSAESLKTIEQLFGVQKGKKIDGTLLMYREKGENGLNKKYYRKVLQYDSMIEKVKKNELTPAQIAEGKKPLTPEEQNAEIQRLTAEKERLIGNMQAAMARFGDAQGARIVMDNPTPEKTEELTQNIIKGIEKGDIEVIDFENYGKDDDSTYFTREQIERISEASGGGNDKINPLPKVKASNYTTTQMVLKLKNGTYLELQIRGEKINDLAEAEHILYKIREGEGGPATVEKAYKQVMSNPELNKKYEQYVSEYYDYSRKLEMGQDTKPPELPDGLDKVLDMDYLLNLVKKGLAH